MLAFTPADRGLTKLISRKASCCALLCYSRFRLTKHLQVARVYIPPKDMMSILLTNQQRIHENIKFADQKAAAFIGINVALLSVLLDMLTFKYMFSVAVIFGLLACLFLIIGIGFAVLTIKPRGGINKNRGPGIIDSARIWQFSLEE